MAAKDIPRQEMEVRQWCVEQAIRHLATSLAGDLIATTQDIYDWVTR